MSQQTAHGRIAGVKWVARGRIAGPECPRESPRNQDPLACRITGDRSIVSISRRVTVGIANQMPMGQRDDPLRIQDGADMIEIRFGRGIQGLHQTE